MTEILGCMAYGMKVALALDGLKRLPVIIEGRGILLCYENETFHNHEILKHSR